LKVGENKNMKKRINDLNLKNWKQYKDILTDSLWIIPERDRSGAHTAEYHGNFIPQIPNQLMQRFTKKGDVVLDAFLGSGTTLIECRKLGRNGVGIELVPKIANKAKNNIAKQPLLAGKVFTDILVGDSANERAKGTLIETLKRHNRKNVQLIIMHPPYHDIIKFSNKPEDLSNIKTVEGFVKKFGVILNNFVDSLDNRRHLAVVIGDKYTNSEWVPLGFYLMQEVMKNKNLKLKGVLIKNMVGNRAKRNQENLWRYRALVGGFYIFRHEYILLFQKL